MASNRISRDFKHFYHILEKISLTFSDKRRRWVASKRSMVSHNNRYRLPKDKAATTASRNAKFNQRTRVSKHGSTPSFLNARFILPLLIFMTSRFSLVMQHYCCWTCCFHPPGRIFKKINNYSAIDFTKFRSIGKWEIDEIFGEDWIDMKFYKLEFISYFLLYIYLWK